MVGSYRYNDMVFPFIGRKRELAALSKLLEKGIANLVVVQGRRRIGKSRLIEEFAKDHTFYQFSGVPPTKKTTHESQLKDFASQLSKQTGLPEINARDWNDLFVSLYEKTKSGRVIILFDEISWMGSKDPDFLGKLKNAWDIYFKKNPKLILILCGSVSSWIEENILASTGFLGRISYTLTLEELPLKDCNQFWLNKGFYLSPFEKFKLLSVTGGVPRYLEQIIPSLSAEENIKELCFKRGGPLVNEFTHIFSDLFSHRSSKYKTIVNILAKGSTDISTLNTILKRTHSGAISEYLNDLEKSGFITRDYTWQIATGKLSKLSNFRLSDNYLRFYLKYIDPHLPEIQKDSYEFSSLSSLPGWNSIMGLQFENLVLHNHRYLKEALNISASDIITSNPYFQRKTKKIPGCQIDYMIQANNGVLYVCEIKFSRKPIGKEVISQMQQKLIRLKYPKGYSIRPVLIHVNGVSEELKNSEFFVKIIDFGRILTNKKPD